MIRTIIVALDGVLVPRLSRSLWLAFDEQAQRSASKAINAIYPQFVEWKKGNLPDEDLWASASQNCGVPADELRRSFFSRIVPDVALAEFLVGLSAAYSVVIRPDVPASVWQALLDQMTALYPPPVQLGSASSGIECSRNNAEELYLVADSPCAYALSGARARVILYTNLFRLRRELTLQGLVLDK